MLSNFLPAFTGIVTGAFYSCWEWGKPSPWTPRAQGALATLDLVTSFPIDLRKADVIAQHLAWQGALHEITDEVWAPSP